jgi:hypothetical protein
MWMFFLMTQPEERERTREWFWFLACSMLAVQGQYAEVLKGLKNVEADNSGVIYSPKRFVHAGHWTVNDIARHFNHCGLRTRDANTLFNQFAINWIRELREPPSEPDWSKVPAPIAIVERRTAQQKRKDYRKAQERERRGGRGDTWGEGSGDAPVIYVDPPPTGEATTPLETAPAAEAPPQPQEAPASSSNVDATGTGSSQGGPMNLDEDQSRM